jgi:hypothetical protein
MDYKDFYWLEEYLFDKVGPAFREAGELRALDFYAIIHWKAARAKTRLRDRLGLRGEAGDLKVRMLGKDLWALTGDRERMELLLGADWKFRLPMASAILSVLWPDRFTIYDWRVARELGVNERLGGIAASKVWPLYAEFVDAVRTRPPAQPSLRDADRYLWGRSQYQSFMAELGLGARMLSLDEEKAERLANLQATIENMRGIGWDDGLGES